jgi:4-hydroxy-4-methyl-2-oxoglutarate aldolase
VVSPVVVVDCPRVPSVLVEELGRLGVATVHEAAGRSGLCGIGLHPIKPGLAAAGTAITALCWPGDNLAVHVAVEQCRQGDVLVIATTSKCSDGYVGELLATSLRARGVVALVTETGVRDVAELRRSGLPVWSRAISAQGTTKAQIGGVNVPVALGGTVVHPGDAIVADDDGVVCVPRARAAGVAEAGAQREAKERASRARLAGGELGLDFYGLRGALDDLGVRYVQYSDWLEEEP